MTYLLAFDSALTRAVIIESAEVVSPGAARLSVRPSYRDGWAGPARRLPVRWHVSPQGHGKGAPMYQCRAHLVARPGRKSSALILFKGRTIEGRGGAFEVACRVPFHDVSR